ncbi:hypothetical protein BJ138DRAFT_1175869 [Hygrophoropsis aurantiaca]|uniref:Uncharacterized protein n=1 Tax=Hygrophoropsis aurantiaca TaxID=72124 RepID=A0ACB8AVR8_9AGAM|nr:hypothetical protein BJ138DRAFT_1175869 [Hygrophoropsis aurantiaca]
MCFPTLHLHHKSFNFKLKFRQPHDLTTPQALQFVEQPLINYMVPRFDHLWTLILIFKLQLLHNQIDSWLISRNQSIFLRLHQFNSESAQPEYSISLHAPPLPKCSVQNPECREIDSYATRRRKFHRFGLLVYISHSRNSIGVHLYFWELTHGEMTNIVPNYYCSARNLLREMTADAESQSEVPTAHDLDNGSSIFIIYASPPQFQQSLVPPQDRVTETIFRIGVDGPLTISLTRPQYYKLRASSIVALCLVRTCYMC